MNCLHIIKIGGNVIDDAQLLEKFIQDFSAISGPKILVHGGGKLATSLANSLGIKQTMVDGRRITDAETLNVTVMVYAGLINKTLVAKLQALQCNAMGFSGADGNLIKSKKRQHADIDFGFVGDVLKDGVDAIQFKKLLDAGLVPVICPITHDGHGNLLNTNADTMASVIAMALKNTFDVSLVYCFEKKGVLKNTDDDGSWMPLLNAQNYQVLKSEGIISKGMIPKLDNAFGALEAGIAQVLICHADAIAGIKAQITGTQLAL